ncbi:HAD hydrolase-like protein [Pseudomonas sp. lyk4-TYG-107]|uniref:HAD hydrolase-like protein n=1 Tax=Pseudomonas sp. lyk4-TYG-107 TaxID=3040317 RepID=UPI002552AF37|nr:HAD hydrolase-like protein [Pseudomonas sp. lyk4-TYG-107]
MFELCLFDLDQTLVKTDDLTVLRESGKNKDSASYRAEVVRGFATDKGRIIYSHELIKEIRAKFPELKLGVFTRAPRSYAEVILEQAYPGFEWDTIVAYEDVKRTKPYGDGVGKAMQDAGCNSVNNVILVGDGDADIRAGYNAGCVVVLDKSSWGVGYTNDNWRAMGHIPDVIIKKPEELIDVLVDYTRYLPELERLLYEAEGRAGNARYDRINKFIPKEAGGDKTAFPIFACGRSFAGYKCLEARRSWHKLTASIHKQKDAEEFPYEWVQAVRMFILSKFKDVCVGGKLTVTVIPHRPGRTPRLEAFLSQLQSSYAKPQIFGPKKLSFVPDLLGYKNGVRSNSNDKLSAIERFENVRDHLIVRQPEVAKMAQRVLVIDDVSTTGSTLIYAKKYLEEAGVQEVVCLSIAANISSVIND